MKRILHLTIHLYGAAGAERQLMLNVNSLDPSRFENYLCCVEEPRDLAIEAAKRNIPVYSLHANRKSQWPGAVLRLRKLVRELQIDLIHTSLFDADILGGIAGRISGVPVVSTLCNISDDRERLVDNPHLNQFKLTLTTKAWGFLLRSCQQRYVAISNAVRDSAIRGYGLQDNRITVIYRSLIETWDNGGGVKETAGLSRDLGVEGAYPLLLNVARLVPQKGQRYLIEAMPAVVEQFPRAHLMIAGEGPLKESLASLSRQLDVDQHVTFLGRRNDVGDLLDLSDMFVFPSLFEGLGGALIEAASAKKACIASRVGPLPEVVEEGRSGLLVSPQSSTELAQSIIRLAGNRPLAQTMGERGKQIVAEKFNVANNVKYLEEMYSQVLCQHGSDYAPRSAASKQ